MIGKALEQNYLILEAIQSTGGSVGANALSLRLGFSPATLGRRMQMLEYQGYIEKNSNKGRVLTDAGARYLEQLHCQMESAQKSEELRELVLSTKKQDMLDMLIVRRALEVESVGLACKNITDGEIFHLDSIIHKQDVEKAANRIGDKQDLTFHLGIAQISGNKCIERMLKLLLTQDSTYVKLSIIAQVAKNLPHSVSHHRIVEALQERNRDYAQKMMAKHITFYIEYVEQFL